MDKLENSNKKFTMGWMIVIGCMIIQAIPFGVASNIQPQFVSYVVEGEGFTLASFSLLFTIGTVISAVASPIIGYLYSRISAKLMFLVGCILSGGGFLAFYFAHSLWQFYIFAGISQIGTAAISAIGVPLIINAWFGEEVKGKAMGLAFAGGSIGNIFLQQLVAYSLASQGYSRSYLLFGILSLVVGIPVTLLMIRMPKDHSEVVRAKNKSKKDNDHDDKHEHDHKIEWGYSLTEVKQSKYFWLFSIGFIFIGIYVSALAVQYPAYLRGHLGLSATFVGFVGSTFALFSLFGNIVGGFLFDRLGAVKTLIAAFTLAGVACICLIFAPQIPQLAFGFATLKGLSVFAYMMGPAYLTGIFFGKKEYGAILGIVNLMFAIGFAAGSSIFGFIVDKVGYFAGWSTMLASIILGYIIVILVSINMKKINAERMQSLRK